MKARWIGLALIAAGLMACGTAMADEAKKPEAVPAPLGGLPTKVDLNTATLWQLRQLPTISRAWGVRIISNRPYRSVADLRRTGLPPSTIARLSPLVVVAPPRQPQPAVLPGANGPKLPPRLVPAKVDLNSASLEQLQNLPGVEPGMAAHILAGRPYMNLDDLVRDGVPVSTVEKIRPVVMLGPPALVSPESGK